MVGVRLHEAEDDKAEAGYARRRERADRLGYAYGLTVSAMVSHGDSFGGMPDARGTRPVPGCPGPIRQPSYPRSAGFTSPDPGSTFVRLSSAVDSRLSKP